MWEETSKERYDLRVREVTRVKWVGLVEVNSFKGVICVLGK